MAEFLERSGATERLRCPPDESARVLFGILQATTLSWLLDGQNMPDPARHAAHAVDLFLRGVARPPGD